MTTFRTETEQIDETIARERVFARLLTPFGAFALLLASIGLYGATAYGVARRTGEIGVRIALGARQGQVRWLVLRQTAILAAIGLAIGVPASLAAAQLLKAQLFGVKPADFATIAAAGGSMLGTVLLAGWIPARRAGRVDPLTAIRME